MAVAEELNQLVPQFRARYQRQTAASTRDQRSVRPTATWHQCRLRHLHQACRIDSEQWGQWIAICRSLPPLPAVYQREDDPSLPKSEQFGFSAYDGAHSANGRRTGLPDKSCLFHWPAEYVRDNEDELRPRYWQEIECQSKRLPRRALKPQQDPAHPLCRRRQPRAQVKRHQLQPVSAASSPRSREHGHRPPILERR